ncbi:MAG: hypothetical protein Q8O88_03880 [bacterium]|nr:hypothetical protein [bacterium]
MLKLTITIEAKDLSGLKNSIDEVRRVIANGNRSGFNGNDDEKYSFEIQGEEEKCSCKEPRINEHEPDYCQECGKDVKKV